MPFSVHQYRERLDARLSDYRLAKKASKKEKQELLILQKHLTALEDAQFIAQQVAQHVQTRAHNSISTLVTRCLQIFDQPYTFHIDFVQSRGRTEARLRFSRDGIDVNPLLASGGGVVDVAAFALRISAIMLTVPPVRRLLVADEPFRFVNPKYHSILRKLLETLSEELSFQFIIVTHDRKLRTGMIIELT